MSRLARLLPPARRALQWAAANGRGLAAAAALAVTAFGLWDWLGRGVACTLGGGFVLAAMVYGHLRGGHGR